MGKAKVYLLLFLTSLQIDLFRQARMKHAAADQRATRTARLPVRLRLNLLLTLGFDL